MKRIRERTRRKDIRACVLWREDLQALFTLVKDSHGRDIKIQSGKYEFESLDELLSSQGPRISEMSIEGYSPQESLSHVSITLKGNSSSLYVYGQEEALAHVYSELEKFFLERRSWKFRLGYGLTIVSVPVLLGAVGWLLVAFAPNSKVASAIAAIAFILSVLSLFSIIPVMFISGTPVVVRNESRTTHQFSRTDRFRDYASKLLFALLGAALAVVGQLLLKWLR